MAEMMCDRDIGRDDVRQGMAEVMCDRDIGRWQR